MFIAYEKVKEKLIKIELDISHNLQIRNLK